MTEIGDHAPDFALRDDSLELVRLADLLGHKSLVVFIPSPFTSICEAELCTIRDSRADLNGLDAQVVAITCNTAFSNRHWSEENDFGFRVLSDFWPHGETSRAYGAFNERFGIPNRHTFVLDADGIVRDAIKADGFSVGREFDLYTEALSAI